MTRRTLATIALSTGLAVASAAGLAIPARAAVTGDTTTTFTLSGGLLSITVPASKALGSVATGSASTAAAQLGTVAVGDARGTLLGTWTASVSSTAFTTGAATANETIANSNADYWSGAATATTGTGVFLPGQATALAKVTLGSSRTAFSASALVGNNTASWNPTVNVNIPSAAVAGDYTGTITHSVA
ncbi:MAG TPA: hypothetical protein VHM89_03105 [Acidimicrobiales bacterium]|nr:hypothetical protein [Acidimicrobiales bacterium]